MAKTKLEEANTLGDILDLVLNEFTEEARKEVLKQERKEFKNKKKAGLFFYTWWALKSEEDLHYLYNNNSAYPRDIGKGSRSEYQEPGTKDQTIVLDNTKPTGKVVGKFLGINGTTALDAPFVDQAPGGFNVDFNEYPIIALGAAIARVKDRGKSTEKVRVLNPEDLRWKWDWKHHDKVDEEEAWIKGRVVDIEKVQDKLGIDIDYDTEPGTLTKEQVERILDESNDVGVDKASVLIELNKGPGPGEITNEKGYFHRKDFNLLNKQIICKANKNKYEPNKTGHINPKRPFTLTSEKKEETKIIIPLVKKEVVRKPPIILIYPFTKTNKHETPLKPPWDSDEQKTNYIAGRHIADTKEVGNEDVELGFHSRKKLSQKCRGGYYYLFLATKGTDGKWVKVDKVPWKATVNISRYNRVPYTAGELEQYIPRISYENRNEWGFKGAETIILEFDVPRDAEGEFRLYALMAKGEQIPYYNKIFEYDQNKDKKEFENLLYDFNYKRFTVGGWFSEKESETKKSEAKNELGKALKKWEKKHKLLKENKNTSLKWHYKADVKTMKTIEKELKTLAGEANNKSGENIPEAGDKVNITVVLEMIERVIKAWTEESPEAINLLLQDDTVSQQFGPKTHYNLYNRIVGIKDSYSNQKKK